MGWQWAGATRRSHGFTASRTGPSSAPRLSVFRNRFYDQSTGRWTQEDPIGVAGGVNLYQFNGNNPAMFTDPFGLCDNPKDPKCKKGAILTLSFSASAAHSVGGNVEGGIAINLGTGDAAFYAHAGPTAGLGASAGGEVAVQAGSIEETVGRTGDPQENAVEMETGGVNLGGQLVLSSAKSPSVVGGGGSVGLSAGTFANGTAVAGSTGTFNLVNMAKRVLQFFSSR